MQRTTATDKRVIQLKTTSNKQGLNRRKREGPFRNQAAPPLHVAHYPTIPHPVLNYETQAKLIRERDDLRVRSQHLQTLLADAQQTIAEQTDEIRVLRLTISQNCTEMSPRSEPAIVHMAEPNPISSLMATITSLQEDIAEYRVRCATFATECEALKARCEGCEQCNRPLERETAIQSVGEADETNTLAELQAIEGCERDGPLSRFHSRSEAVNHDELFEGAPEMPKGNFILGPRDESMSLEHDVELSVADFRQQREIQRTGRCRSHLKDSPRKLFRSDSKQFIVECPETMPPPPIPHMQREELKWLDKDNSLNGVAATSELVSRADHEQSAKAISTNMEATTNFGLLDQSLLLTQDKHSRELPTADFHLSHNQVTPPMSDIQTTVSQLERERDALEEELLYMYTELRRAEAEIEQLRK
ncbi:hypothetical protein SpCBS45565_g01261 [Spizellomyces sp. 'palustris']|nr:hypothetical protein SpCBS45565_g01261 [Spizellomyces sp. 'palustris']